MKFLISIGNLDKNIFYSEDQTKTINDFITKYKILNYEISTKPYYNFPKFFTQFIIDKADLQAFPSAGKIQIAEKRGESSQ